MSVFCVLFIVNEQNACFCLQTPRWHITLEPWASESHSLEEEAKRFLNYITTPQVSHHL